MIPHIETSRIEILYKETMSRVESKDQKEQKKAYRLLEELCRGPSPAVRSFLTSALPQLRSSLLSSLSATSPSSQVNLIGNYILLPQFSQSAGSTTPLPHLHPSSAGGSIRRICSCTYPRSCAMHPCSKWKSTQRSIHSTGGRG